MMMITFLFFFKFVIDTALIVSAKINLQNAADLAAYSGAAAQARQMNHIAYLNYEMRRQYKKFLFRYYVLGAAFQRTNTPEGLGTPRLFSPDGTPNFDFKVPVVCVPYRNDSGAKQNLCQVPLTALGPIQVPAARPQDRIMQALNATIRRLNQAKSVGCAEEGAFNAITLFNWLYNGNPELDELQTQIVKGSGDPAFQARMQMVFNQMYNMSRGLGLIPSEALLLQRIRTLEGYVNQAPRRGVTLSQVRSIENERDKAKNERTVLAFLSAMNTLGPKNFTSPEDVTMDELLPMAGNGRANLLKLNEIQVNFSTYYMNFAADVGGDGKTTDGSCKPQPEAFPVFGMPFGVYKDPESLVYYGVRLKGRARLLFSSVFGGSVELTAYAAAQPFGSRIGPAPAKGDGRPGDPPFDQVITQRCPNQGNYKLVYNGRNANPGCALNDLDVPGGLPNIQLSDGTPNGFLDQGVIASYGQLMGLQNNSFNLRDEDITAGIAAAMAPNPIERGRYAIPNDAGEQEKDPLHSSSGDPYEKFFTRLDAADRRSYLAYAFWAPLYPPEATTGKDIRNLVEPIIRRNEQLNRPELAQITQQAIEGLTQYVQSRLKDRNGERSESFNVAVITDPLRTLVNGAITPITLPNGLLMTAASDLRTAYVPQKSNSSNDGGNIIGPWGRVGYSVKYVAFKTLANASGLTTDGKEPWKNGGVLINDPDANADGAAEQLEH